MAWSLSQASDEGISPGATDVAGESVIKAESAGIGAAAGLGTAPSKNAGEDES